MDSSGLIQQTWDCHFTYLGVSGNFLKKKIFFLSEDLFFTLTNSVDPDEMPHYATFHLGVHCL